METLAYGRAVRLSVAAAGACGIAAVVFSLRAYRATSRANVAVTTRTGPEFILAHELRHRLERVYSLSRAYQNIPEPELLGQMDETREAAREALASLQRTAVEPDERELLRRIDEVERRRFEVHRVARGMIPAGKPAQERWRYAREVLRPLAMELERLCDRLIEVKAAAMLRSQEARETALSHFRAVVLASAAFALATFGALVLTLRRFTAAMEEARAELERRVAERTAELRLTNRELESFSYSAAHHLRTPLRAITNFGDLLMGHPAVAAEPAVKARIERIRLAGRRMGEIIDSLLMLARLTQARFVRTEVDISALAREIVEELVRAYPERAVSVEISDGLKDQGDEKLLIVALRNLLDNAWKFTAGKPDAAVEIGRTQVDGASVYFVRDNGVGFDPAHAEKLLLPFETAHQQAGAGIGLPTADRIIRKHGGSLWADGRPNGGATFYFTLGHRLPDKEAQMLPERLRNA